MTSAAGAQHWALSFICTKDCLTHLNSYSVTHISCEGLRNITGSVPCKMERRGRWWYLWMKNTLHIEIPYTWLHKHRHSTVPILGWITELFAAKLYCKLFELEFTWPQFNQNMFWYLYHVCSFWIGSHLGMLKQIRFKLIKGALCNN